MTAQFKDIDWTHEPTRSAALGYLKDKWQCEAYEDAARIAEDNWDMTTDQIAAAIRARTSEEA
jgi:hypothetical protein